MVREEETLSLVVVENLNQLDQASESEDHGHSSFEEETRDWRSLPDDVLRCIAGSFSSLIDFYSFRNACADWRAVVVPSAQTLASQSPILLLPIAARTYDTPSDYYSDETETNVPMLSHSSMKSKILDILKRFCIQCNSADTVSQTSSESVSDCAFPKKAIIDVKTRKFCKVPPFLSWGENKLLNFSHGYLAMYDNEDRVFLRHMFTQNEILLPKPEGQFNNSSNIIFSDKPTSPECIFLLFDTYDDSFEFCKRGDHCWKVIRLNNPNLRFNHMVFFKGVLYALVLKRNGSREERLAMIDLIPESDLTFLATSLRQNYRPSMLFCSGNELMLLNGYTPFKRWDFEATMWVEVSSLDRKALFVSVRQITACVDQNSVLAIEPNFLYYCNMFNDYLSGHSLVETSRSSFHLASVEYRDEIPEFIGRSVWVFPSQCF